MYMYQNFICQNSELGNKENKLFHFNYISVKKVCSCFEYEKPAGLAVHQCTPCVFWDSCGFAI